MAIVCLLLRMDRRSNLVSRFESDLKLSERVEDVIKATRAREIVQRQSLRGYETRRIASQCANHDACWEQCDLPAKSEIALLHGS